MSAGRDPSGRPAVFGEVLFDRFAGGERVLGGAPFNVAWHLQGLGLAPLFVSCVGADAAGDEVAAAMQDHGMTTAGLQRDPRHPTGEVRVTVADGQPTYDIVADRAYDHIRADAVPGGTAMLVYHGTLALRAPTSASALQRLVETNGARVFVDVNLRAPWWRRERVLELLRQARWAKLNDQELATLANERGDARSLAQRLLEAYDLEQVVVTLGAAGALCVARGGTVVEAEPVASGPVVDTVGAGDAFAAVWIAGLLRAWAPEEALRRAQALAGRIVVQRGALLRDAGVYRALRDAWHL